MTHRAWTSMAPSETRHSEVINGTTYEWGAGKDRRNLRRHGMSLRDGAYVIERNDATEYQDDAGEPRFRIVGYGAQGRLLVVILAADDDDQIMNIISVRPAEPYERRKYERRYEKR